MVFTIFTTKKLEKFVKKYITPTPDSAEDDLLGKWNADVFYIERRKNCLLYNAKTHYSLILEDISAKDLPNMLDIIREALQRQLVADGIQLSSKQVRRLVERINFHVTDTDRSTLAFMNQLLHTINVHQHPEYSQSLAEIIGYHNSRIYSRDGASKFTNLTKPKIEIEKILEQFL